MTGRVVKFRAWDGKKMFYPSSISWKGDSVWCCEATTGANVYEALRENACLMQFTGLQDKAGHDIFEGDIVEGATTWGDTLLPIAVVYEPPGFAPFSLCGCDALANVRASDVTVIGNRYESPHLLDPSVGGK